MNKISMFTDIHWGAQNNNEQHNKDCLKFIDWFCEKTLSNKCEAVIFGGDWFQHRISLDGQTLDYSRLGALKLNELNIPIYFTVGNHDLYFRHNRSISTTQIFSNLKNFYLIDKPIIIKELGEEGTLLSPYLFHNEYPELINYNKIPVWFLHAEFQGFVITGDNVTMKHGPKLEDYSKPKRIFSGHFHKRQENKNCIYVGSPFATSFSDANDFNKGMMIYNYKLDNVEFIDYNGPSYVTTSVNEILESKDKIKNESNVKCLVDVDLSLEESIQFREELCKKYNLRSFSFEEPALVLPESKVDMTDMELESTNSIIEKLLDTVNTEGIDKELLKKIHKISSIKQ